MSRRQGLGLRPDAGGDGGLGMVHPTWECVSVCFSPAGQVQVALERDTEPSHFVSSPFPIRGPAVLRQEMGCQQTQLPASKVTESSRHHLLYALPEALGVRLWEKVSRFPPSETQEALRRQAGMLLLRQPLCVSHSWSHSIPVVIPRGEDCCSHPADAEAEAQGHKATCSRRPS